MTEIVMPAPQTGNRTRLKVSVHLDAEVLPAETVRRQANVWLLEHIGNLLRAESPELVLREPLVWRLDIVLTSPTKGRVGMIGRLEIDAVTGEVLADETLTQELLPLVHAVHPN